jgi:uncharacterized membrane protein
MPFTNNSPESGLRYNHAVKKAVGIFCAVVLLALVLRTVGITFESLWLDEAYQSMVDAYGRPFPNFFSLPAQPFIFHFSNPGNVHDVLQNFRSVDPLCPPLYQLMLNGWIHLFGGADLSVRLLSVVIDIACLSAVYWFSFYFFGVRAALFAGLIQSISGYDIYYSQEVRMYSLVALTATLSCGTLIALLFKGLRGGIRLLAWTVYCLSVWALINAHYTGLFVFATQIFVVGVVAIGLRSWRLIFEMVLACLAIGALWAPWFDLFRQAAAIRGEAFYVARKPSWWWPIFALFFRIPANWVLYLSAKQVVMWAVPVFITASILLLNASIGVLCFGMRSLSLPIKAPLLVPSQTLFSGAKLSRQGRNAWLFLWAWAVLPAVGLWILDVKENHRVIEISRYAFFTAPAIFMLAGVGLSLLNWRNKLIWALLAAHIFFSLVQDIACTTYFYQREPWRKMAQELMRTVPPDEPVLISQYYDIACLDRYLTIPYKQVAISPAMGKEHLQQVLAPVKRFALITAQDGESIVTMIDPSYKLTRRVDMEHGLHLREYEKKD